MKDRNFGQFLEFLMSNDSSFRISVLFYPLLLAIGSFILGWLLRGKSLLDSLFFSGLIFLLACFVGIIYQAVRRKNLR
jgi:hypothetical protein